MAHTNEQSHALSTGNNYESNEREPLLQNQNQDQDQNAQPQQARKSWKQYLQPWPTVTTTSRKYRFVPLLGCAIILFNEVEYFFKQVPVMRSIEAMYCVEYYERRGDHPELVRMGIQIPEQLCKADSIEKDVARTTAWILMFRMLLSCIAAIPLGYIADAKSRRLVLLLHKFGTLLFTAWCMFVYLAYPLLPIWTIYLSGIGALVGGNFDLNMSVLLATYTDVIPDSGERARLFYYTTSMQYIGQLIFPPITGRIMNLDGKGGTSEIPLAISTAISIVSGIMIYFAFPETRDWATKVEEPGHEEALEAAGPKGGVVSRTFGALKRKVVDMRSGIESLGVSSLILFGLAMLLTTTGIKSTDWFSIIQYPVIKLGWTFPETTLVLSLQAIVYLLNFAVLLPAYNKLGAIQNLTPTTTALSIMLFSSVVLTGGATLLGLSASTPAFLIALVVYTLGTGLPVVTQAYLANLIAKDKLARVMAVLSLTVTGGKLIASGITPQLFAIGIDSGVEALKGLPMLVSAGLFAVSGVAVVLVAVVVRNSKDRNDMSTDP